MRGRERNCSESDLLHELQWMLETKNEEYITIVLSRCQHRSVNRTELENKQNIPVSSSQSLSSPISPSTLAFAEFATAFAPSPSLIFKQSIQKGWEGRQGIDVHIVA
jgi:hypothetical protein